MGLSSALRFVFVEDDIARLLELAERIDYAGPRRLDLIGARVTEHRNIVAQALASSFRQCAEDLFLQTFGGTFERERQLGRIHIAHEALHVAWTQPGEIFEGE